VTDATGQALVYVYFEDEAGRRRTMKRLTKDEARRIAANIAKLPEDSRSHQPRPYRSATFCWTDSGRLQPGGGHENFWSLDMGMTSLTQL
jgi:hypothetical protein